MIDVETAIDELAAVAVVNLGPHRDRLTLTIGAMNRVPSLQVQRAHARQALLNRELDYRNYAYSHGIDTPEIVDWQWPI